MEIIGVQLPGRENRFSDSLIYDLPQLIKNLIEIFPMYFDKPFVFFGHSVGSIISFELAHALREKKCPLPQHLIVSGTRAPHLPLQRKKIYNLPDSEFISELSLYNGIPAVLLEDPDLLSVFIPMIRADFTLFETYVYTEKPPLPCPITAFGGVGDPYVSQEEIFSWKKHTYNQFKHYFFEGDHFFLTKESYSKVVTTINQILFKEIEKNI